MAIRNLDKIFRRQSIAVIGASEQASSVSTTEYGLLYGNRREVGMDCVWAETTTSKPRLLSIFDNRGFKFGETYGDEVLVNRKLSKIFESQN